MIMELLSYDKLKKHIKKSKIIGCPRIQYIVMLTSIDSILHMSQGILLCKKLCNKQGGSVIFRPVRLITLYYHMTPNFHRRKLLYKTFQRKKK